MRFVDKIGKPLPWRWAYNMCQCNISIVVRDIEGWRAHGFKNVCSLCGGAISRTIVICEDCNEEFMVASIPDSAYVWGQIKPLCGECQGVKFYPFEQRKPPKFEDLVMPTFTLPGGTL